MLFGVAASCSLIKRYSGVSAHRRTVLYKDKFVVDTHVRVKDGFLGTSAFVGDTYLHALGSELGSIGDEHYVEIVTSLFAWLQGVNDGRPLDQSTILCEFPADGGLYSELSGTVLYRCFRYMLSKYSWVF